MPKHDTEIAELCRLITEHVEREWPTAPDRRRIDAYMMKLTEEVGELAGAIVKHQQNRTDEEWLANAFKEYGDVMIVLAQVAVWLDEEAQRKYRGQIRVTMLGMMVARWKTVRRRIGASYRAQANEAQPELPPELLPQAKVIEVAPAVHDAAVAAAAREPDLMAALEASVLAVRQPGEVGYGRPIVVEGPDPS